MIWPVLCNVLRKREIRSYCETTIEMKEVRKFQNVVNDRRSRRDKE